MAEHAHLVENYAIAVIELKGTDTTDLDKIVYELYGLSEAEIKIVEGAV